MMGPARIAPRGPQDTWLDRSVHRRLSRGVTRAAVALGIAPNAISVASLLVGGAAAWSIWQATPGRAGLGLLLYFVAVVLDHADGEVARLTGTTSEFGHRLDVAVDTAVHALVVVTMGEAAAALNPGQVAWLGPVAAAGVILSAATRDLVPLGASLAPTGPAARLLEALGNRDGFYGMVVAFAVLLASLPAWLPVLMGVVAAGANAYWIGRVTVGWLGRPTRPDARRGRPSPAHAVAVGADGRATAGASGPPLRERAGREVV
jgi:phosphatidylglycerophosphate synthase